MVLSVGLVGLIGCVGGCAPHDPVVGTGARPVINGTPTMAGQYPAVGALVVDLQPTCSGTLITPNAVLTAAHCLDPLFIGDSIPGFTRVLDANLVGPADVTAGAMAIQHPDFDLESEMEPSLGQWNDIGVLILSADVPGAELAILPDPAEAMELLPGISLDLVGYGLTSNDSFDVGVKHHGSAKLVQAVQHELFISEPGEQQNCNGDSGGPAFAELSGGTRIVGTVSRAPDTNPVCDHGGIDTRVDAYLDWIHLLVEVPCGGLEVPCSVDCVGDDCDGEGGGCGCRSGSGGAPAIGLVLLALIAVTKRRRRV